MFRFVEHFRRYLLILTLGFWMGGFTCYALIVLPTSHGVLGDHFASGLITRGVTIWLNRLGLASIMLMLWDALASSRTVPRWLVTAMLVAWLVTAVSHLGLFVTHPKLDALVDVPAEQIIDPTAFRSLHTVYERIAAIQWIACLVFLWFDLLSWRHAVSKSTRSESSQVAETQKSI